MKRVHLLDHGFANHASGRRQATARVALKAMKRSPFGNIVSVDRLFHGRTKAVKTCWGSRRNFMGGLANDLIGDGFL
jgi:hypothetical protein